MSASTDLAHMNVVVELGRALYQASCLCGWMSYSSYYEEVDLLRAMHAHAVTTFQRYRRPDLTG